MRILDGWDCDASSLHAHQRPVRCARGIRSRPGCEHCARSSHDSRDADELPSGQCAERTYAVVRHDINSILRQQGFNGGLGDAIDEHACAYLADAHARAMSHSALSQVAPTRMHEEICIAIGTAANELTAGLRALLPAGAATGSNEVTGEFVEHATWPIRRVIPDYAYLDRILVLLDDRGNRDALEEVRRGNRPGPAHANVLTRSAQ